MDYIRIIVAPILLELVTNAFLYVLLSPKWFNLEGKINKRMAEQEKYAVEEKYVSFNKKSLKTIRFSGILVVVCSLLFSLILCFYDYLNISDNSLAIMIGLSVVLWLCSIFDCIFFFMISKKVTYNEEGFTVINGIGKKRSHTYDEVVDIKGNGNKTIKLKKGKIILFAIMPGLNDFINYLSDKRTQDKIF